MIICGPLTPMIHQTLKFTGLDDHFEIEDLRATG
jgi:hypothetical protein